MDLNRERLDLVIRAAFRSQRAFAQAIGVHETTVSYWLRGTRSPSVENLAAMTAVGVNVDYLFGNSSEPFTDEQAGHVAREKFDRYLTDRSALPGSHELQRELAGEYSRVALPGGRRRPPSLAPEIERISIDQPTGQDVIIPMLESSIPAGDRVPIYEDLATSFNVTQYYRNCFTMRVKGDSMMDAGICDGDRVVIKRTHRFRDGDVIAAVVDGEMTLKGVWKRDGRIYLVPANPKYRVVEIAEESEFQCLGVCVDTFRPPKRVEWRE